MSMDFPRAWDISRSAPMEQHNPQCSYVLHQGGFLCDCHVLFQHPEYGGNTIPEESFTAKEEKLFEALFRVVGATTREELEGMIAVVEEALKINPGHRTAQVSHNAMKILLEYWPSKKC